MIASCPDGSRVKVDFKLPISEGKALYFASGIAAGKPNESAAVKVTRLPSGIERPMIWRVVVRRAGPGEQFERVIVRDFDDDLKAIRFGMWQSLLARLWGEFIHVQGPGLVITPRSSQ